MQHIWVKLQSSLEQGYLDSRLMQLLRASPWRCHMNHAVWERIKWKLLALFYPERQLCSKQRAALSFTAYGPEKEYN